MKKHVIVSLATMAAMIAGSAEVPLKISVLENSVLCVRASRMPENVTDQIRTATATNHLTGTVLDLRFADGAGTNAADYFLHPKSPLVILVNSQTRGTAAALATELRASASAVVIGSTDSPTSLAPDIVVAVSAEDEKKFQENPFFRAASGAPINLSATNNLLAFVDHTSEAELVRKRIKDGDDPGNTTSARAEPPQPVIRDPALARAVDLLKALAVLHPASG